MKYLQINGKYICESSKGLIKFLKRLPCFTSIRQLLIMNLFNLKSSILVSKKKNILEISGKLK